MPFSCQVYKENIKENLLNRSKCHPRRRWQNALHQLWRWFWRFLQCGGEMVEGREKDVRTFQNAQIFCCKTRVLFYFSHPSLPPRSPSTQPNSQDYLISLFCLSTIWIEAKKLVICNDFFMIKLLERVQKPETIKASNDPCGSLTFI